MGGGEGGGDTIFLHIYSSWVKIRLHTKNKLPRLSGSALFLVGLGLFRGYVAQVVEDMLCFVGKQSQLLVF